MSANPVQHQRTKHIEIDIHFVRDFVASGQVRVLHVPSRFQYTDIFTKGLLAVLFLDFRSSLNVHRPPTQTAGERPSATTRPSTANDLTADALRRDLFIDKKKKKRERGPRSRSQREARDLVNGGRALRSPRRELRNELNYVQSGVKMNEISCLKVRHVEHKIWELKLSHIAHKGKWIVVYKEVLVRLSSSAVQQLWTLYPGKQTANLF
ncbi:ribonuclease H-like domain-containing protein [Tanacetum coccineum]